MTATARFRSRPAFLIAFGLFAAMLLLIILFCSGLNFPVIGPQSSFANSIRRDFKLEIPPSLKVLHAARCAMRDPAYYYECTLAPADVLPFKAQLEAAAVTAKYTLDDSIDRRFSEGPPSPAWYTPASLPDRQSIRISLPESASRASSTGYYFFFSPTTGKLYIFWYAN